MTPDSMRRYHQNDHDDDTGNEADDDAKTEGSPLVSATIHDTSLFKVPAPHQQNWYGAKHHGDDRTAAPKHAIYDRASHRCKY